MNAHRPDMDDRKVVPLHRGATFLQDPRIHAADGECVCGARSCPQCGEAYRQYRSDNLRPADDRLISEALTAWASPESYREDADAVAAQDGSAGLWDAIGDWVADARFLSGCYVGIAFTCVCAWVVAF